MSLITSWVESANRTDGGFPLNNLPFGVYSTAGQEPVCCTAIGDFVLDLDRLQKAGLVDGGAANVFSSDSLNGFMAQGQVAWDRVRQQLITLLQVDGIDTVEGVFGEFEQRLVAATDTHADVVMQNVYSSPLLVGVSHCGGER